MKPKTKRAFDAVCELASDPGLDGCKGCAMPGSEMGEPKCRVKRFSVTMKFWLNKKSRSSTQVDSQVPLR